MTIEELTSRTLRLKKEVDMYRIGNHFYDEQPYVFKLLGFHEDMLVHLAKFRMYVFSYENSLTYGTLVYVAVPVDLVKNCINKFLDSCFGPVTLYVPERSHESFIVFVHDHNARFAFKFNDPTRLFGSLKFSEKPLGHERFKSYHLIESPIVFKPLVLGEFETIPETFHPDFESGGEMDTERIGM